MEQLFYPESIAIWGLSEKPNNNPRLILDNLIRWGYKGRISGINPNASSDEVAGVKLYKNVSDLPLAPDLAVALIPARYVPKAVEECGVKGVRRMAIPSGGFNEMGEEGQKLARQTVETAQKYGIRFVGPNGLTIANTANGLCIPFVPSYPPLKGGISIITQSGGLGIFLWNMMESEQMGMAKFASIGNKLDLDEADFLSYFGKDPETKVICMYLESITDGRRLMEIAEAIDKPIIVYKSNRTRAGGKAAMSHTASLSNNDDILNAAFKRAGIIRVHRFEDFISTAKAFDLPPMRGNRLMVMSPAGGLAVSMADLCEDEGFEFANPGQAFFDKLSSASNAGIIRFSNPLDMGDIYNPAMYAKVFHAALHNDEVDGAVYVSQWPKMPPGGTDVFTGMFNTDISRETVAAIRSSGKPLGLAMFGQADTMAKMKKRLQIPVFNGPEEMLTALRRQKDFYAHRESLSGRTPKPQVRPDSFSEWLQNHDGIVGEEALDLFEMAGLCPAPSDVAHTGEEAVQIAESLGYPVVLKVVSPDAIHKSEAGGVPVGLKTPEDVSNGFLTIQNNLSKYRTDARFDGVRVMKMAPSGFDMFVGGHRDPAFGPVVFFGFGGIYVEIFKDVEKVLAPADPMEIWEKLKSLRTYPMLAGARGKTPVDVAGFTKVIETVCEIMAAFPEITELDLNPVRLPENGGPAMLLDARMRIESAELQSCSTSRPEMQNAHGEKPTA